jgi:fucose permease
MITVLLGPMLPLLSARWSLNYAQAGRLFPIQYITSTAAVAISGWMVSRWGFRFAMKAGLLLATAGVALLLMGPKLMGLICLGAYGTGLGLAVPAANLMVAEVNPGRRSAILNVLNFCWSSGAVACPFLVSAAAKRQSVPLLLGLVAGFMFLVMLGIAAMPASIVEPVAREARGTPINWRHKALPLLGILFFAYVGTENAFGLWLATYSQSLGTLTLATALMTPSFFYAALTLGRLVAPFLLRSVKEGHIVQAGLLVACVGMAGLMLARGFTGVLVSASLAGLGLSSVYPIFIAQLSREFGTSASRVGSIMFTLANLGGAALPWLVGVSSTRFGTLKAGVAVPLIAGAAMFILYLRDWTPETQN